MKRITCFTESLGGGGNLARYICTVEEYFERNKQYNVKTKGLSIQDKKNSFFPFLMTVL